MITSTMGTGSVPDTPAASQPTAAGDAPGNSLGVTGVVLAAIAVVIAAIPLLRTRRPTG